MELSISKTQQNLSGCTELCRKMPVFFSFNKVTFSPHNISHFMWLCYLFPGDGRSGPLCTRGSAPSAEMLPFVLPRGWAKKRWRQRAGLGPNLAAGGGGVGGCCIFAVVFSWWLAGRQLVLSQAAACLSGQIAPLPPPPSRQHASLLRPDWPRPALYSGRLISFTEVKGARLRGARAQTGGPFIPKRLDWSP